MPRSNALWQYLTDRGLTGPAVDPAMLEAAMREYRKLYKATWRTNRQIPMHDLRPAFTQKEYRALKEISQAAGFKHPTTYIKQLVVASLAGKPLVPDLPRLQKILQLISMSAIATSNADILNAEDLLLNYIKNYCI